jgi:hypothetical protein
MTRKLQDDLAYPPRAMKPERAAAYLDMSRTKFLELVESDRLPKPKVIDGIRVWDRLALMPPSTICRIAITVITCRHVGIPSTTC